MFFYIVLTPISITSGIWSTGNTRKYHQIDVYIYQCVLIVFMKYFFEKLKLKKKSVDNNNKSIKNVNFENNQHKIKKEKMKK